MFDESQFLQFSCEYWLFCFSIKVYGVSLLTKLKVMKKQKITLNNLLKLQNNKGINSYAIKLLKGIEKKTFLMLINHSST